MSLSLKLHLHSDNKVIVTNSINQEKKEVTLAFIQQVTRNSLDILIQYKFYEIMINAQSVWNQIKNFDSQTEAAKEIKIERKFKNMMTPGSWIEITDYEREMYNKALPWINTYNHNTATAKTLKVIRKLENFGWQIIDKSEDHIVMINYSKQASLLIPNSHELEQKILIKLIDKAGLSIEEFFSSI